MRASRLLQILLLLQNRGRMTSAALARELEVAPRTILRDVDALTEAGLPVIVHQGQRGGIELGFNYRTRLTGLATDEAEAMALILSRPMPELADLGLSGAAERARSKMLESFPDRVRDVMAVARQQFRHAPVHAGPVDPRLPALASAIRQRSVVRIRAKSRSPQVIHPVALLRSGESWQVIDALAPDAPIPLEDLADVNISARTFADPAE
jgi:predicted DNA-binding transcriptional regulator YafY